MKNIACLMLFFLLGSTIFSQESKKDFFNIDFPQKSFNRNTFIGNELTTWLSIVELYDEIKETSKVTGLYFTSCIDTVFLDSTDEDTDYNELMELDEDTYAMVNLFLSLSFRINKYLRIPLYTSFWF